MSRASARQFYSQKLHDERLVILRAVAPTLTKGYSRRTFAKASAKLCGVTFTSMVNYLFRGPFTKEERVELGIFRQRVPFVRLSEVHVRVATENYADYLLAVYHLRKKLSLEMQTVKNLATFALTTEDEAQNALKAHPELRELLTVTFESKKLPAQKRDDSILRWERANAKSVRRVLEPA